MAAPKTRGTEGGLSLFFYQSVDIDIQSMRSTNGTVASPIMMVFAKDGNVADTLFKRECKEMLSKKKEFGRYLGFKKIIVIKYGISDGRIIPITEARCKAPPGVSFEREEEILTEHLSSLPGVIEIREVDISDVGQK